MTLTTDVEPGSTLVPTTTRLTRSRAFQSAVTVAVIGFLMLAYCFPAAYVTLWPDTVRDFAASLALVRGEKIPLTGPGPINFGPYAGPAWIFLQAPPLLIFPSFAATSIYVAMVASLKFPALYDLAVGCLVRGSDYAWRLRQRFRPLPSISG